MACSSCTAPQDMRVSLPPWTMSSAAPAPVPPGRPASALSSRVPAPKNSPNPTLTSQATPGPLYSKTERMDCSLLDEALASRLWGLPRETVRSSPPSASSASSGARNAYEMLRARRLEEKRQRAAVEIPETLCSLQGRPLQFNTARREFGTTPLDQRNTAKARLRVSDMARMRAQLAEQTTFNENLLRQLNVSAAAATAPSTANSVPMETRTFDAGNGITIQVQKDGNVSIPLASGNAVLDPSTSSLTRQLFEDKRQGDKVRERLVHMQNAEVLREKARDRRRMSEMSALVCGRV